MSNQRKVVAIAALAGAIAGGAVALLWPARYVSSAVLQIHPAGTLGARQRLAMLQPMVLSRGSLVETIQRPGIDLYRSERARLPLEDIIDIMRARDLKIEPLEREGAAGLRIRISFEYPDRAVAPLVVRDVVRKFRQQIVQGPGRDVLTGELDGTIEPIEMPQGPGRPTRSLPAAIGIGLGVGALLGPALLWLRRRSWQWHLIAFGFAIAGGLAGAVAAFYGEFLYPDDVWLCVLGAGAGAAIGVFLLRRRAERRGKVEVAIAATAAGAIVAGLISFALPVQYQSKSVMRIYTVAAPGTPSRDRSSHANDRISRITENTLSRSALVELIQRPALDLYRAERSRIPMEEIVKRMRTRDLRIAPVVPGDAEAGLEISFRYRDRFKAQAVAREVVSKFMEENFGLERRAGGGPGVPGSLLMEVLEPPDMPQRPVAPNRLLITGAGAAVGLVAVLLTLFIRRQSGPRRLAMLRFGFGAGVAGAVVAAAIAFAIPSRYVSTAALRIVQPPSGARDNSIAEDLQMRIANVVSAGALTELIQRPSLDLYPKERAKRPLKEVIQRIRARDLRIETLTVSGSGITESLRISFEYPDRVKAQEMVRAVVSLLVEGTVAHPGAEMPARSTTEPAKGLAAAVRSMRTERVRSPQALSPLDSITRSGAGSTDLQAQPVTTAYVEVLDAPSMPDTPELPDRTSIVSLGLIAGLLLGPVAALLRREARPATAIV